MKFLTLKEGQEWLKKYGFGETRSLKVGDLARFESRISYLLPKDSGAKTNLAGYLAIFLEGECFFWITEHEIWPSSDNKDLFYAYRGSIGEYGTIDEVPCHVFEKTDKIALKNLISLVLYFFYDVVMIKKFSDCIVVIYLSHDEIIEVFSDSNERIKEIKEVFENSYRFTPNK